MSIDIRHQIWKTIGGPTIERRTNQTGPRIVDTAVREAKALRAIQRERAEISGSWRSHWDQDVIADPEYIFVQVTDKSKISQRRNARQCECIEVGCNAVVETRLHPPVNNTVRTLKGTFTRH